MSKNKSEFVYKLLHFAMFVHLFFVQTEILDFTNTSSEAKNLVHNVDESVYIDLDVRDLSHSILWTSEQSVFHLFSHGQPGELLINGEWLGPQEILAWFKKENHLKEKSHLNIYGCNFAKGEKGRQAVSYLETTLGLSIAASDDITGIDGDWDLEVGTSRSAIQVPNYKANLQLCPDPKYSVFVHYSAGSNNTNAARYTIISSKPNFFVTIDQTNHINTAFTALDDFNIDQEWVPLGYDLEFDATGNIAVRLEENASPVSSGMWINADAVMFVDQFGNRTIIDNFDGTQTGTWNLGGTNAGAYNNRTHFIQTGKAGTNNFTWTLKESEVKQSDDDQDGIPNGCDLDDDNDGILDLVECTTNDVTNGTFTGLSGWTTTGNWFNRGGVDAYVNNNAAVSSDLSQFVTMNSDEGIFTYDLLALAGHPRNAFIEVYVDNVNVGRYSAAEIVAGAAAQGTSYYRVQSAIRGTCGGTTEIMFRAIVEAGSGSANDVGVDNIFVGTCDTDGDCVANHLEVDSDNDDCGDAIEATGSTYLLGDLDGGLAVDIAIHPIDTNGVPANSTNIDIGSSTNDQIQNIECDECSPLSSFYMDSDGDGIGNACDADDDNDGIEDCDERFTGGVEFKNPLGTDEHFFPDSYNTYTGSIIDGHNVRNGTIDSDTINGTGNFGLAVLNGTGGGYQFVVNQPISQLQILPYTANISGIFSPNDIITFDADVPITIENPIGDLKVYINGVQNTATSITTSFPITIIPSQSFGISPAPNYKLTMLEISEFTIHLASSQGSYPNGATFRLEADCLLLDTDGDGIPDSIDPDADGDGCPDALESTGSPYTWADLNIDGSINTTLHPVGPEGYNGGNSFGEGTSKIDSIQSPECDACNSSSSLFNDNDLDGIGDVCDLDDDNDGILDVDEIACVENLPIDFSNFNSNGTIPDITVNGELVGVTANLISGGSFIGGDANGNVGLQVVTVGVPVIFELEFSKDVFPVFGSKTVSTLGFFEDPELWDIVTGTSMVVTDLLDELDLPLSTEGGFTNSVVISPAAASGTNNPFNQSWQVIGLNSRTIRLEYTNSFNAPNNSGVNLSVCTKFKDTDGDGIADYQDLDSDGDGCPDAIEAGVNGGLIPGGLQNNIPLDTSIHPNAIVQGPYGNNGLSNSIESNDSLNAGTTYNSTYNLLALDSTLSGCSDKDGDGVPDLYDIDDDNDGILDIVEMNCIQATASNTNTISTVGSQLIEGSLNAHISNATYSVDLSDAARALATGDQFDGEGVSYNWDDISSTSFTSVITIVPDPGTYFDTISWGPDLMNLNHARYDNNSQDITLTWSPAFRGIIRDPDGQLTGVVDGQSLSSGSTITQTNDLLNGTGTWYIDFPLPILNDTFKLKTHHEGATRFDDEGFSFTVNSCANDIDGDGIPSHLDLDSDNDGIPDAVEACGNLTVNLENCMLSTSGETLTDGHIDGSGCDPLIDSDGDGTPDYQDLDSDGDGCPDSEEAGSDGLSSNINRDTFINVTSSDVDNCGLVFSGLDSICFIPMDASWINPCETMCSSQPDKDGDGVPDIDDLDDDNDGICDTYEKEGIGFDISGALATQIADFSGSYLASNALDGNGATIAVTDGNTETDWWQVDIGSVQEIKDIRIFARSGQGASMTDVYIMVSRTPFLGDDLMTALSHSKSTRQFGTTVNALVVDTFSFNTSARYIRLQKAGTQTRDFLEFDDIELDVYIPLDTDGDGINDHVDLDSDNDGIPDAIEYKGNISQALIHCMIDTTGSGATYEIDTTTGCRTGVIGMCMEPLDTDGDGSPDFRDLDSDGDGCPDSEEAGSDGLSSNINIDTFINVTVSDVNECGLVIMGMDSICFVPMDSSWLDPCLTMCATLSDMDGDGVPDIRDLDDDNDGICDIDELVITCGSEHFDFSGLNDNAPDVANYIDDRLLTAANAAYPGVTFDFDIMEVVAPADNSVTDLRGNNDGDLAFARNNGGTMQGKLTFSEPISFVINEDESLSGSTGNTDHWKLTITSGQIIVNDPGNADLINLVQTSNSVEFDVMQEEDDWEIRFINVECITLDFSSNSNQNTSILNFSTCEVDSIDTDMDGIADIHDLDSDNDGIVDAHENFGNTNLVLVDDRLDTSMFGFVFLYDTITGCNTGKIVDILPDSLRENPMIELTKSSMLSLGSDGVATVGDTIIYDFIVTNTGDVLLTGITLTDANATIVGCDSTSLQAGNMTSCSGYYLLTQTDINTGEVQNIAEVTGTSPSGTMVKDTSDSSNPGDETGTPQDTTKTTIGESPMLTLTKSSMLSLGTDGVATVGDTIFYGFVVSNTGNVPMTGISISDANATIVGCDSTSLQVGNMTSCSGFYLLTQTDINTGEVQNIAEVTGTSPSGTMVKDTSDSSNPGDETGTPQDTTKTTIGEMPELSLTKSSMLSLGTDGVATVGDTIFYGFVVSNTGNVPLTSITLTDANATIVGCDSTSLQVGNMSNCSGFYLLTQTDINTGEVQNIAEVTGTSPSGTMVKDTSDSSNPGDETGTPQDTTKTTIGEMPELSLTKSSMLSLGTDGVATVGDTIFYGFVVSNTGNVPMTGITISDANATIVGCDSSSLQVGNMTSCSGYYLLTQTDINTGEVQNIAEVTGTSPSGTMVKDTSDSSNPGDETGTPQDTTKTTIGESPMLALTKSSMLSLGTDGVATVGDTIFYGFVVSNTGNVPMTGITISDANATIVGCDSTSLQVGNMTSCSGFYLLTQTDINTGEVQNIAEVTGTSPSGTMVKDTSDSSNPGDETGTPQDTTKTTIGEMPELSLTKSSMLSLGTDGVATVGDTIFYGFVVSNTGNVPLTSITLTDANATIVGCDSTSLQVGNMSNCSGFYLLTQTDINTGEVQNIAEVTGTSPSGTMVKDTSDSSNPGDETGTPQDTTKTTIGESPMLALTKSSMLSLGTDGVATVGDTIFYGFVVSNTGNVPLTSITLTDANATIVGCDSTSLQVGNMTSCSGFYLLTQTDINTGEVQNIAEVTGTSPSGTMVKDTSDSSNPGDETGTSQDTTKTTIGESPMLTLTKSSMLSLGTDGVATVGDTIFYGFVVSNTGNVPMTGITISDANATIVGCDSTSLQVGNMTSCSGFYLLTQTDINTGEVQNIAEVTGTSPSGTMVKDTSDSSNPGDETGTPQDTTKTTIGESPMLTLTKSSMLSLDTDGVATVGDTIFYGFVVSNTGNVPMTGITISDANATIVGCDSSSLQVGNMTSCSGYYLLTQTDINTGEVQNIAEVTGTSPSGTMVKDTSDSSNPGDETGTPQDTTKTTIGESPMLALTKSSMLSLGTDGVATVGDTIFYGFVVSNTGNVPMTGITISDANATIVGCDSTSLQVGNMTSCSGFYLLTQTDINTGEVQNIAEVTGTSPSGTMVKDTSDSSNPGDETGTPQDTTKTTIGEMPELSLTKSSMLSLGTDGVATVGDTIFYGFVVSNTGNVPLTSITLTDANATIVGCDSTSLQVGNMSNCSGFYLLTQTDINTGEVQNIAEVTGTSPSGTMVKDTSDSSNPGDETGTPQDTTKTTIGEMPELSLTKSSMLSLGTDGVATVGDTIFYGFVVSNTGNVPMTGITISDANATIVGCDSTSLQVGNMSNCSGFYLLTQTDINTGEVQNIAEVTGTSPSGTMVKDTSDSSNPGDETGTPQDTTKTTIGESPMLSLTKSSMLSLGTDGVATVGDTIFYGFVVSNTGNVPMTGITISDANATIVGCDSTSLQVGNMTSCSGFYLLTQIDINTGEVQNIAEVTGTSPSGTMVKDTSDSSNPGDETGTPQDTTKTTIGEMPELSLTKSSMLSLGTDGVATVGDTIFYGFVVSNTGNVPMTGITISDANATIVGCDSTSLQVGNMSNCSGFYLLTQTDINTGEVQNIAEVTGTSPSGTMVKDTSDSSNPGDETGTPQDTTKTTIGEMPELSLTKSSMLNLGTDGVATVGDTIFYGFVVSNTGNVPLTSITLSDANATIVGCDSTSLQVGNMTSCSGFYLLTQTDINTGEVQNIAEVTGTSPSGTMVKDTSDSSNPGDETGTPQDTTKTTIGEMPELSLTKSSMLSLGTDGVATVGDTIFYGFVVSNTGNVPMTGIIISDANATIVGCDSTSLQVGNMSNCSGFYLLTQTDINTGEVQNIAEVTGTSPSGTMVKDTSDSSNPGDETGTPQDTTKTTIGEMPELSLTKSSMLSLGTDGVATVGDTIFYGFVVSNTGNVPMTGISISDANATIVGCDSTSLQVGNMTSCSGFYLLTQTDINTGEVQNIAEVTGTSPSGTMVKDTSDSSNPGDETGTPQDTTKTTIGESPMLTLTKSSMLSLGTDGVATVGDTIFYGFVVSNTGNVPMTGITISDANATIVGCDSTSLQVGNMTSCSGFYLLTQTDINTGEVQNIAEVTGTSPSGTMVKDTSDSSNPGDETGTPQDTTKTTIGEMPELSLTKSSMLSLGTDGVATVGDTIFYGFVVSNTGNVPMTGISISDANATMVGCDSTSLQVGNMTSCSGFYLLTQTDINTGEVQNIAEVTGTSPSGTMVKDTSDSSNPGDETGTPQDTTKTTIGESPMLTLTKSSMLSLGTDGVATVGDTIFYGFVVSNTGNVPMTGITISDANATIVGCDSTSLQVGNMTSCSGFYLLTQTDINTGEVQNIAEVTGTSPSGTMVKDTSDSSNPGDETGTPQDTTKTTIGESPMLTLTKSSMLSLGTDGVATVGDTIFYGFVVSNTGNVPMTGITISDANATIVGCDSSSLQVGNMTSCSGFYLLTQTDINTGEVQNIAEVTGTSPSGTMVKDTSDSSNPGDETGTPQDTTKTTIGESPMLTLTKSSMLSLGTDGVATVGDTIFYGFVVSNTGNVPMTGISISDANATIVGCDSTSLQVGNMSNCSGFYLLTQTDINTGEVQNIAEVTGTSPSGTMVKDTSDSSNPGDETGTPQDTTKTTIGEMPELSLTKSSMLSLGTDGVATVGDTIFYGFVVSNTGNVPMTGISISDANATIVGCDSTSLQVGNMTSCSGFYLLTQTDINTGEVQNIAEVTGTSPSGTMVKDTSDSSNPGDETGTPQDTTKTTIGESPMLSLTKSSMLSLGTDGVATVGDTIFYGFVVSNTGNVPLTSITLTDANATIVGCDSTSLQVGNMTSCSGFYLLTQTDINTGEVQNIAEVTGTSPSGTMVKDTSDSSNPGDETGTPQDTTKTTIGESPMLTLTKSSMLSLGTDGVATVGDTIFYGFVVSNTGNVPMTGISISDANATIVGCDSTSLQVGNMSNCSGFYLLTQTDINTGEVQNIAEVTGTSPSGTMVKDTSDSSNPGDEMGTPQDTTKTTIGEMPEFSLTKSSMLSLGTDGVATVGDTIFYGFVVSNTGNVPMTGISISDANATIVGCDSTSLQVGNMSTCSGFYLLTQTDINTGEVQNIAEVTGTSPSGTMVKDTSDSSNPGDETGTPQDTTKTTIGESPMLSLTKSSMLSLGTDGVATVGDTIFYGFVVSNTGNVPLTSITLTDANATIVGCDSTSLQVGNMTSCSGFYLLTQTDINTGEVQNIAEVTGTSPSGTMVKDTSDSSNPGDETGTPQDTTKTTIGESPMLTLTKSSMLSLGTDGVATVGDTIFYGFVVSNTGNVPMTGISISDANATIVGCDSTSLQVGNMSNCSGFYLLTQTDINTGEVQNIAEVTGTSPSGTMVKDTSDSSNPGDETGTPQDTTKTTIGEMPELSLTKSSMLSFGSDSVATVGDTIFYGFVVSNTGNVPITGITISDANATIVGCDSTSLQVGSMTSCSGYYLLTQTDINTGEVQNIAEVSGTSPSGTMTKDTSDSSNPGDEMGTPQDTTKTTIGESPMLTLTKSSMLSLGTDGVATVGDTIFYGFVVSNTGNVPMTGISISDANATIVGCDSTSLQVGNMSNCSGFYLLTQTDINTGEVQNIAEVTGTSPSGTMVKDTSDSSNPGDETGTPQDTTKTTIGEMPELSLTKSSMLSFGSDSVATVGDTIFYGFVVSNTGNVPITGITISDANATIVGCDSTSLQVGSMTSCSGYYLLTQTDINTGEVQNIAEVSGTSPSGTMTKDTSDSSNPGDETGTPQDTTKTTIGESPMLSLTKSSMLSLGTDGVATVGDTIFYGFVVSNTGNVPLTSITLTDANATIVGCDSTSLQVGNMTSCSGFYLLTQTDINTGEVQNIAEVSGTSPSGTMTKDTSDSSNPGDEMGTPQDTTKTSLGVGNPEILLIKYVDEILDNGDGISNAGDTILYKFIVRNTGNLTLTDVTVVDNLVPVMGGPIQLEPYTSDSLTFTARYVLMLSDATRGYVDNTATVYANPPLILGSTAEIMDISDTGTDQMGQIVINPENNETPSGNGGMDQDSSNDPTPVCVVRPLTCPDNLTLPSCTTQSELDLAFESWLFNFAGGGCGTSLEFTSTPIAPDKCGGEITVTLVLRDQAGNLIEDYECSSTFSVAFDNEAPVCPANWNISFTSDASNCIAPGYNNVSDLEDATGYALGDNCTPDMDIIVSYRDSLIPANCASQANGYFDTREVIRTYTFEDACGNKNESCPQTITYNVTECQNLTSFGEIEVQGETQLNVPSGCNVPLIQVSEVETGICGYVEYMWLISTQEDANGLPFIPTNINVGTTWLLIDGANEATYDPGIISQNTYFVRCVRNFSCCEFGESNIVAFRIDAEASCPVGGSNTIVNKDCDNIITLTSPNDDVINNQMIEYITDKKIQAQNKTMLGSSLSLDGKTGVEMNSGFEIETNSKLEVYTTGCQE